MIPQLSPYFVIPEITFRQIRVTAPSQPVCRAGGTHSEASPGGSVCHVLPLQGVWTCPTHHPNVRPRLLLNSGTCVCCQVAINVFQTAITLWTIDLNICFFPSVLVMFLLRVSWSKVYETSPVQVVV